MALPAALDNPDVAAVAVKVADPCPKGMGRVHGLVQEYGVVMPLPVRFPLMVTANP